MTVKTRKGSSVVCVIMYAHAIVKFFLCKKKQRKNKNFKIKENVEQIFFPNNLELL